MLKTYDRLPGAPVTSTTFSDSTLTFPYPAGAPCDAIVTVTNPDGQSGSGTLNPTPVITNAITDSGPASGGALFGYHADGLAPGSTLTIGGIPANLITSTGTVIVGQLPPGTPGPALVVITTPGGCSVTTTFTYL